MSNLIKLYEGKAKILYQTDDPQILITHFKDDATAFNAQKKGQIPGKGAINCSITTTLYKYLESKKIPTHLIEQIAPNQIRVRAVKILPIEVVVRNIIAGSISQQTGLPIGMELSKPLVEYYYKNDSLGDPLLTNDRLELLQLATTAQINTIKQLALTINQHLKTFFSNCQITLVDFKLEFGLDQDNQIRLADEISPDTCRLWDNTQTNPNDRVLDKDRFRRDLGKVAEGYLEVQKRVLDNQLPTS